MVMEFDDFGCNHIISDMTQSHDCRDALDKLHFANLNFKVTLFAIPAEMTYELLEWCRSNESWVQLALHGFYHKTNTECLDMTYEQFDDNIKPFEYMIEEYFVKGFRAPGWQISDGVFNWLQDHGWWVADQSYNNDRRPESLKAYVRYDGPIFKVGEEIIPAYHGHVWDVGKVGSDPNGIYEAYNTIEALVKDAQEYKFIGEIV